MLGPLLIEIASAATLTVGPTGQYATIAEAVVAAVDMDRIVLEPGTYDESVTIDGKHLYIDGPGASTTQWTGTGLFALRIDGDVGVRISGVTFSNPSGRCIRADDYGMLQVVDTVFTSCHASNGDGGAIYAPHAWLDVRDSMFVDNSATSGGHIDAGERLHATRSTFIGGVAANDGGALALDVDRLQIVLSTFQGNTAGGDGGAIFSDVDGPSYVHGGRFLDNHADGDGGAIYANGASDWFDVYYADFCGNEAGGTGGAIWHDASLSYIQNTSFVRNQATGDAGAVYYGEGGNDAFLWHDVFLGNSSSGPSGGLLTAEDPWVWNSIFDGNTPNGWNALDPDADHDHNLFSSADQLSGLTLHMTDRIGASLFVDPGTDCDYDLHLAGGSAAIDNGDPNEPDDIDGTTADIGVFGGPSSPDADADGDGTPLYYDCDDGDASFGYAAVEVCNGVDDNCNGTDDGDDMVELNDVVARWVDDDEDGYGDPGSPTFPWCDLATPFIATNDLDCDDLEPDINPDALEVCDGLDNDCNQLVDDGVGANTFYRDADGDGFGDPLDSVEACGSAPIGYVVSADDCDDANPAVFPTATELCNGVDDDCDQSVDENLPVNTYLEDADGDGWGGTATLESCSANIPPGYVEPNASGDCDDTNPSVFPGQVELCNGIDDDCDLDIDENLAANTFYDDDDGDGFGDPQQPVPVCGPMPPPGTVSNDLDCNDDDATVSPGVPEACDGIDRDCNGAADDGLPTTLYYTDADEDGFGDATSTGTAFCDPTAPSGYAAAATDCDDSRADVNPDADELCDGVDHDCDGNTQAGAVDAPASYQDADGDGYGFDAVSQASCAVPVGFTLVPGDCNDGDEDVHPDADELCNDIDDDCDGSVDEDAVDLTMFYLDEDGDTYGTPDLTVEACDRPEGYAEATDDCNDASPTIHPNAPELCDSLDNDCDQAVDESVVDIAFYPDDDGDGYGDAGGTPTLSCAPIPGRVSNDLDCDDSDPALNPNAVEQCDGIDSNCSGDESDAIDPELFFFDGDGDGWGVASAPLFACEQPVDGAAQAGDCNDAEADAFPGNTEICDQIDNNCDGVVDADAAVAPTWRQDQDGDGYGTTQTVTTCIQPPGYGIALPGDCDDSEGTVFPGAPEICDGRDNDCDGLVDADDPQGPPLLTFYPDTDDDGFGAGDPVEACAEPAGHATSDTDCDDSRDDVFPGAPELCTGIDNDCDGTIEDVRGYLDADGDGFGATGSDERCNEPGLVGTDDDCDDTDDGISPAADEIAGNGIDEDCDGADAPAEEEPSSSKAPSLWFCATATPLGWAPLLGIFPVVARRRR